MYRRDTKNRYISSTQSTESNLNLGGNLNLSLLPIVIRHTIPPTNTSGIPSSVTRSLRTNGNIHEAELKPRLLRLDSRRVLLLTFLGHSLALIGGIIQNLDVLFVPDGPDGALVRINHAIALGLDELRVGNADVGGLEDLFFLVAFSDAFDCVGMALEEAGFVHGMD